MPRTFAIFFLQSDSDIVVKLTYQCTEIVSPCPQFSSVVCDVCSVHRGCHLIIFRRIWQVQFLPFHALCRIILILNVHLRAFCHRYEHSITCSIVVNSLKLICICPARDAVDFRPEMPRTVPAQRAEEPPNRKLHDLDGYAKRPGNVLFLKS